LIKAIIFDFDGVIVDSADIKTEAFKKLFSDYPKKSREIVNYHLLNAGISRYVKFRYVYKHILRKRLSKDKEIELGKHFSQIVLQKIINALLVAGAEEFLDTYKNSYQFFIASGTPEDELYNIINTKGLQGYFKEIHGSPKGKTGIINSIIQKYGFSRDGVVYVGDSESDRLAAEKTGIAFIERKADLDTKTESNPWIIKDLTNLNETLQKIELENRKKKQKILL
jgi:phosphoglycolate phosphatase-like HAD superfamily hydrolase